MKNYLFGHFRQSTTPEGVQFHFALSQDGFNWHAFNGGNPNGLMLLKGEHVQGPFTPVEGFDLEGVQTKKACIA